MASLTGGPGLCMRYMIDHSHSQTWLSLAVTGYRVARHSGIGDIEDEDSSILKEIFSSNIFKDIFFFTKPENHFTKPYNHGCDYKGKLHPGFKCIISFNLMLIDATNYFL